MINKKLKNIILWVIIIMIGKVYQWMMRELKKARLEVYLTSYKMQAFSFQFRLMFPLSFLNIILMMHLENLGSQGFFNMTIQQIKTIIKRNGQRK